MFRNLVYKVFISTSFNFSYLTYKSFRLNSLIFHLCTHDQAITTQPTQDPYHVVENPLTVGMITLVETSY